MTQPVIRWHPVADSQLAQLTERLREPVRRWQSMWLGESGLALGAGRYQMPQAELSWPTDWAVWRRAGCLLGVRPDGEALLGAKALQVTESVARSGQAARRIAREVGLEAMTALAECVVADLSPSVPAGSVALLRQEPTTEDTAFGAFYFDLEEAPGKPLVSLMLPYAMAAPHLPAVEPHQVGGRLHSRLQALECVPVRLGGLLGHVELDLEHLSRLAVGDVVLLDRRLDEEIEIYLEDPVNQLAKASIYRAGEQLVLQVTTQ